ncbi:MAG: hypothetical protein KBA85_12295 [Chloroflexi bacterium]|nr:hypothetical protein [Chloroflexota bacterium]
MPETIAHVINHTHWDREWFLTSVYTSRWIPGLIDKLEKLVAQNPDFCYLLDGQTLVIEDLLAVAPEYAERVAALVKQNQLLIGPYYCQPDWQISSGELLVRNLMNGRLDLQRLGAAMETGWLVDTFGHISQSPQLHRMFGLDAVFVWRGVPQLAPYFQWQGADGSDLLAVDLFGGYRNLYGVTHAPEIAVQRLEGEVGKLRPFYPTPDIPLFDGYDLEDNPEDPLTFFRQAGPINPAITLQQATPTSFVRHIAQQNVPMPVISGELNSGKYGATFPGVYSTRTYLKVMAHDCQRLLFQVAEPLAAMARLRGRAYPAADIERWERLLLQNAVHDCICGVSIDQVHEKMEYSYRQAFDAIADAAQSSLAAILQAFAPGDYAISTQPFATAVWQAVNGELLWAETEGIGVWPVQKRLPITLVNEAVTTPFVWQNEHYTAVLSPDGRLLLDGQRMGRLLVWAEAGDTYSAQKGELLGELRPSTSPIIAKKSAQHCEITFSAAWQNESANVKADIRLIFDHSPLLRWQVDLDSRGTDLRVEMAFATGLPGDIAAGMPFDVVSRAPVDDDLLPRQLPADLQKVLIGQRELGHVTDFPFHDFIAVTNGARSTAVLAKGLHAYSATPSGDLSLILRRSVEWLTKADLPDRIGDAGPFFYVPDARCERLVRHEIAVAVGAFAPDSMALQQLNAAYQNPPLIARKQSKGNRRAWPLLQESLPLSSLSIQSGRVLARLYNPTTAVQPLAHSYRQTDVWGSQAGWRMAVAPKHIVTLQLPHTLPPVVDDGGQPITWRNRPEWRVGESASLPDTAVLSNLQAQIDDLTGQLAAAETAVAQSHGTDRLRQQHRCYILEREKLEYQLSHLLNSRKLTEQGGLRYAYLYEPDAEIAAIGAALNRLRIKRRIYDYIVTVL